MDTLSFLLIYSLLGFYWNWRAYDFFFSEGHPRRWEVTLILVNNAFAEEDSNREETCFSYVHAFGADKTPAEDGTFIWFLFRV